MKIEIKKIVLSIIILIAAGVSPNLFVAAQAGYAKLSDLAVMILLPSIAVIAFVFILNNFFDLKGLNSQIKHGIIAGAAGTIGLEIVREIGFHLGGMPGDMPKLLGVLLLNQFALGPDTVSNIAGWSYHFWNGASFGIIYSILFGKGQKWLGIVYGLLIGAGFMLSPAVVAMGVGYFGADFGIGFPVTVILAHLAFGSVLGGIIFRLNKEGLSFFSSLKKIFDK